MTSMSTRVKKCVLIKPAFLIISVDATFSSGEMTTVKVSGQDMLYFRKYTVHCILYQPSVLCSLMISFGCVC